jgi:hypothetical protein
MNSYPAIRINKMSRHFLPWIRFRRSRRYNNTRSFFLLCLLVIVIICRTKNNDERVSCSPRRVYVFMGVRAFDGPHSEFKMAGVVGPVRGRVVRRGVFITVRMLYYVTRSGRMMNRKTAIIRRVADGRKRENRAFYRVLRTRVSPQPTR